MMTLGFRSPMPASPRKLCAVVSLLVRNGQVSAW